MWNDALSVLACSLRNFSIQILPPDRVDLIVNCNAMFLFWPFYHNPVTFRDFSSKKEQNLMLQGWFSFLFWPFFHNPVTFRDFSPKKEQNSCSRGGFRSFFGRFPEILLLFGTFPRKRNCASQLIAVYSTEGKKSAAIGIAADWIYSVWSRFRIRPF